MPTTCDKIFIDKVTYVAIKSALVATVSYIIKIKSTVMHIHAGTFLTYLATKFFKGQPSRAALRNGYNR